MPLSAADRARLAENLAATRAQIAAACQRAGRDPGEVTLVAVTKHAQAPFAQALLELGQLDLGENRVQHLVALDEALAQVSPRPRWHLIGHLQRNKVKQVARRLHAIHSLDGRTLAEALAAARGPDLPPLQVYVQLKLDETQEGRAGVPDAELAELWERAGDLTGLARAGLMGLPPLGTPEEARPHFRRLAERAARLGAGGLSMGMSADLEVAIEEGATVVRVGSALLEGLSPDALLA